MQAREKIKTCPHCGKAKPTTNPSADALAKLIVLALIVGGCVWWFKGNPLQHETHSNLTSVTPASAPSDVELNETVRFDGSGFTVRNNDSFDWTEVKLVPNQELLGGYKFEAPRLAAGQTYTVGAMQFTKKDGTRFNPFATKPLNTVIDCNTPCPAPLI